MVRRALWGVAMVGGTLALAVVLLAAFGLLGGEPRQMLPVIAIVPAEQATTTPGTGAAGDVTDDPSPGATVSTQGTQVTSTTTTISSPVSPAPGRQTVPGPLRSQVNGGEGRTPAGSGPGSSQGGGR